MKFDSKLLLEQLIRTHILEQSIVTDTNVKRGKVGSATSYGSIDSPSNVSSADSNFFNQVNSITRTNPKSKRPYIKLYSNVTKGGTASENDRLQSVAGIARREASALIDRFGGPGALSEYSAIISKPQDAKKQADASTTVPYDPSAKLYYTVVFIMTTDINSTISPEWGVVQSMKFFGEDQISSLKPAVTTKDDEVIDDTSKNKQDVDTKGDSELTPDQLSDQFITKKSQLDNLGTSGAAAVNLQRAMYTVGMKAWDGKLKEYPQFNSFVTASWNTTQAPGKWDGDIAIRTRDLIAILKGGFEVESDQDLYKKLQDVINEIQPNLTESKLYKLTEQDESGFNFEKAAEVSKNLRSVNRTDSSGSENSTTTAPVTKSSVWKCVLAAAYAADEIWIDGKMSPLDNTRQPTSSKNLMNKLEKLKKIDYIVFNRYNQSNKYYPDGTKRIADGGLFKYDCTDPILQPLNVVTKKDDIEYRNKVIQSTNSSNILIDGKSISELIYDAALFLKAFWAGDDLDNYTYSYSWYSPFTAVDGFKLADWRDSYTAWGLGFDAPDETVVDNYYLAGNKMIKLLVKQIDRMRNTEFYIIMDALHDKISVKEVTQLKILTQLQRDVTNQAEDAIFNQVDSDTFTYYEFSKNDENPGQFAANVFDEKPSTTDERVSIDYE
jgi:hypothetical protein